MPEREKGQEKGVRLQVLGNTSSAKSEAPVESTISKRIPLPEVVVTVQSTLFPSTLLANQLRRGGVRYLFPN